MISTGDFITQVFQALQGFGGMSGVAKIAVVITILISSMKVSMLEDLFWNKLGKLQIWFAPFLGLLAGIIAPAINGGHITLAGVLAYASAGAGAVFLHEILDLVKLIPGIGSVWVSMISAIEGALGK